MDIPVWRKAVLTIEEAAAYGDLNQHLLRAFVALAKAGKSDFPVFMSGNNFKIPRQPYERWLEKLGSEHTQLELKTVEEMVARLNEPPILLKHRGRPRKERIS